MPICIYIIKLSHCWSLFLLIVWSGLILVATYMRKDFGCFKLLISAICYVFFHMLVNCAFKVYFFTGYLSPPSFAQFYWSFASLRPVTLSVLSVSLFLLAGEHAVAFCFCLFPKTLFCYCYRHSSSGQFIFPPLYMW